MFFKQPITGNNMQIFLYSRQLAAECHFPKVNDEKLGDYKSWKGTGGPLMAYTLLVMANC